MTLRLVFRLLYVWLGESKSNKKQPPSPIYHHTHLCAFTAEACLPATLFLLVLYVTGRSRVSEERLVSLREYFIKDYSVGKLE